MIDQFLTGSAAWFSAAAVIGTAFFLLRTVLMLVGLGGVDLHHDTDSFDAHHGDSSDAFKILSIQSIAGFLMGFGWGGLGGLLGAGWSLPASTAVGVGCGVGMMYLIAMALKFMMELQSSGTVAMEQSVGIEGDVYLSVPKAGTGSGMVKVVIGDRQRIVPAVSVDDEIPTSSRVRVTKVNNDRTVTVARV
jgi:hypothetical protein